MIDLVDVGRLGVTALIVAAALYGYTMAFLGRRASPPATTDAGPLAFVMLIACLDEARVIGRTLETVAAVRGDLYVLVIDDDSDDESLAVIGRSSWPRLHVLARHGTEARLGKGAALDAGYREILVRGLAGAIPPDRVIVTVFDADSLIAPDFIERVTPYFADPTVVGVQTAVRMWNADRGWLAFWQDLEFLVWGRIFARAKDRLGSATLGGNGQCVRLSALMALGGPPWRPSLTEDLDLSLRLILAGGRIRYCPGTAVAQEAVEDMGRLVRQRARWVQGHLVAWEYVPAVARSALPRRLRADLLAFLLLPAALLPLALVTIEGWLTLLGGIGTWSPAAILAWYLLAFASTPLTTVTLTSERRLPVPRAILHAHLFLGYTVVWMAAAARAVWSILRGDRAWAKTTRAPADPGRIARRARPDRQAVALLALLAVSSVVLLTAAMLTFATYEQVTDRSAYAPAARMGGDRQPPISTVASAGSGGRVCRIASAAKPAMIAIHPAATKAAA